MREKKYRKQEKGITLIALIITIIVMLILVAVTIQVTISGGIFSKAGEAVGKTKNAMNEEEQIIDKWVEKIDRIENGPNAPELIEGMIPVEWDEAGKTWVKADANTDDWYEYGTTESTKKWANAVTVKKNGTKIAEEGETLIDGSKSRADYQTAEVGTPILQEDILGMYVWIPRYAYKIPDENYHKSEAGIIDIKFIGGTKDTINDGEIVEYNAETTDNFEHFPDGYVVHPAFNVKMENGTIKKITGIWVAKFEASSSTTEGNDPKNEKSNMGDNYGSSKGENTEPTIGGDEVTVRPNVTPWRNISIKNMYIASKNMTKEGNAHGLSTKGDSHLMKDAEWGAVAYLTQSKYGNPQTGESTVIWNNSYYEGDENNDLKYGTTRTGMVGSEENDYTPASVVQISKTSNKDSVQITYEGDINKIFYTYSNNYGVKGSTTGTIYGIYDMVGGVSEYLAAYVYKGVDDERTNYFNTSVPLEHKTMYEGSALDISNNNYELNKSLYGNIFWEVSSRKQWANMGQTCASFSRF